MRKIFLVLVLACLGMCPASAQQTPPQAAPGTGTAGQALPSDAATRDQVLKLLEVQQVRRNITIMLEGMKSQMNSSAEQAFRQKVPNPTSQQLQRLHGFTDDIFSEISVDDLIDSIIPVYQRHLTRTDVDGIVAFYSSAIGQKILREQPAMMRESMQAAGAVQQQKMGALTKKLDERIKQMADEENNPAPDTK